MPIQLRVRARFVALAVVLACVGVACGGSGSSDSGSDKVDPTDAVAAPGAQPGDRPVQINGANKVHLFGTLSVPPAASGSAVPGVLIIPSAGDGTRDGSIGVAGVPDPWARDLATSLSNAGLASYRYDRRGTAESTLDPKTLLTVDDLVADAKAGLDLLTQRKETTGKDISVVGFESSGLLALRLAATDSRIKRVVLIGTPGSSLADAQAVQLSAINGPDSGAALKATIASLIATKTLPPAKELRTEFRTLLPTDQAAFLADLYSIDPTVDAARVKVPVLIVVPSSPTGAAAAYADERLTAAVPNGLARAVTSVAGPTMSVEAAPIPFNPNDPAIHQNGMAGPVAGQTRDAATIGAITGFLSAATPR